ncbi:MAG: sulfotransferase domain-containing protein [Okeania sp. SIO3I5]|uniref:sulfotransferase domain-containing protein n=1 Tax=Okeania sp. SIO3I5 TaxID=2607805 RepID=UPI0013B654F3|nr:sulfotransferase domain-containing protein [Okeania sp. SIO3I5]NEQ39904.1 sulfotransferase domain-containing protein [Okeania sp. SIO3I5]
MPSPKKIVVQDFMRDSTIWDSVKPRSTDIIIASCYKSGTTLTQQIVNLLVNGNDNFESIHHISPWVELRFQSSETETGLIDSLPSPRILKTHLEFEALPYYQEWKYIYLVRDGRDVGVSLYNHCQTYLNNAYNLSITFDNGSDDFLEFWDLWVETGKPRWPFWENINSWWQVRNLSNILLVHYENLINRKSEEIIRIAKFLNQEINSSKVEMICQFSSFEYMKENWHKFQPPGVFKPQSFINKGTNKRWRNLLTPVQLQRYEIIISQKLEAECANWIKNGIL